METLLATRFVLIARPHLFRSRKNATNRAVGVGIYNGEFGLLCQAVIPALAIRLDG